MPESLPLPSLTVVAATIRAQVAVAQAGETARARVEAAQLQMLCAGHFPDQPIVPGAHLFAIACDVANGQRIDAMQAQARQVGFFLPTKCQFRSLTVPDHPILVAVLEEARGSLKVEISSDAGGELLASAWFEHNAQLHPRAIAPLFNSPVAAIADEREIDPTIAQLGHRPPALLLDRPLPRFETPQIGSFLSTTRVAWQWPLVLDACAQAAGLMAKEVAPGFSGRLVVVAYALDNCELSQFSGTMQIGVRYRRKVAAMLQFEAVARCAATQTIRMQVLITLAKMPASKEIS